MPTYLHAYTLKLQTYIPSRNCMPIYIYIYIYTHKNHTKHTHTYDVYLRKVLGPPPPAAVGAAAEPGSAVQVEACQELSRLAHVHDMGHEGGQCQRDKDHM